MSTPAAPSVTPAAQNTAGDATKAPSPVGSLVAMGMIAGVTKKKED
ncbi:hypothetical protein [Lachnoanaerobaculum gingivalis]